MKEFSINSAVFSRLSPSASVTVTSTKYPLKLDPKFDSAGIAACTYSFH